MQLHPCPNQRPTFESTAHIVDPQPQFLGQLATHQPVGPVPLGHLGLALEAVGVHLLLEVAGVHHQVAVGVHPLGAVVVPPLVVVGGRLQVRGEPAK